MKNKLLHILALLAFSVVTFSFFSVSPEEYFWRKYIYGNICIDTCIIEFILLILSAVLSSLIIFVKFRSDSKIQISSIIAFVIINIGVVILSLGNSDEGIKNSF